jgi:hypothetical protein
MTRHRLGALALTLFMVPFAAAGCARAVPHPAVSAADFHHSDPATVGATGRPQLLEFFGPT